MRIIVIVTTYSVLCMVPGMYIYMYTRIHHTTAVATVRMNDVPGMNEHGTVV